jgi:hypothetical protein
MTLAMPMDEDPAWEVPLLAYASSADPDTMYLNEALQQLYRKQLIEAMNKKQKFRLPMATGKSYPKSTAAEALRTQADAGI